MLESDCFFDLTGLQTLYADPDALVGAINDGAYGLKVGQEAANVYTGDLLSDAAFFSR